MDDLKLSVKDNKIIGESVKNYDSLNLSEEEKAVLQILKLTETEEVISCLIMDITERTLKHLKLKTAEEEDDFIDVRYILPTCNICEKYFFQKPDTRFLIEEKQSVVLIFRWKCFRTRRTYSGNQ